MTGVKDKIRQNNTFEHIWSFLSSMRVGISLLMVLTAMSIYGATFLGHQEALDRVYGSWWFIGTLAFTGLNLLVCSLNRWDSIYRRVTDTASDAGIKTLEGCREKGRLPLTGGAPESAEKVRAYLESRGFRVRMVLRGQGFLVSSDKGRFGYFGSLVTHLSLVLILLAALHGIVGGFESFDGGFPGRTFFIPEAGFSVRIEDFQIQYRDDRSIEQFYSTLTLLEDGREVKRETIYVNRPLRHKGVVLYQSTYGWGVNLRFLHPETEKEGGPLILRRGQVYQHPETGIRLYFIDFYPDFTITRAGMPFSRSEKPVNPRVVFSFFDASGQPIGQALYLETPDTRVELPGGYILEFLGWQNYTGFQIVRNPGKPLALFASLLMIAGLYMSFCLFPRRIWAYVGPEIPGQVLVAGRSRRNQVGFKLEFKKLLADLTERWGE